MCKERLDSNSIRDPEPTHGDTTMWWGWNVSRNALIRPGGVPYDRAWVLTFDWRLQPWTQSETALMQSNSPEASPTTLLLESQ